MAEISRDVIHQLLEQELGRTPDDPVLQVIAENMGLIDASGGGEGRLQALKDACRDAGVEFEAVTRSLATLRNRAATQVASVTDATEEGDHEAAHIAELRGETHMQKFVSLLRDNSPGMKYFKQVEGMTADELARDVINALQNLTIRLAPDFSQIWYELTCDMKPEEYAALAREYAKKPRSQKEQALFYSMIMFGTSPNRLNVGLSDPDAVALELLYNKLYASPQDVYVLAFQALEDNKVLEDVQATQEYAAVSEYYPELMTEILQDLEFLFSEDKDERDLPPNPLGILSESGEVSEETRSQSLKFHQDGLEGIEPGISARLKHIAAEDRDAAFSAEILAVIEKYPAILSRKFMTEVAKLGSEVVVGDQGFGVVTQALLRSNLLPFFVSTAETMPSFSEVIKTSLSDRETLRKIIDVAAHGNSINSMGAIKLFASYMCYLPDERSRQVARQMVKALLARDDALNSEQVLQKFFQLDADVLFKAFMRHALGMALRDARVVDIVTDDFGGLQGAERISKVAERLSEKFLFFGRLNSGWLVKTLEEELPKIEEEMRLTLQEEILKMAEGDGDFDEEIVKALLQEPGLEHWITASERDITAAMSGLSMPVGAQVKLKKNPGSRDPLGLVVTITREHRGATEEVKIELRGGNLHARGSRIGKGGRKQKKAFASCAMRIAGAYLDSRRDLVLEALVQLPEGFNAERSLERIRARKSWAPPEARTVRGIAGVNRDCEVSIEPNASDTSVDSWTMTVEVSGKAPFKFDFRQGSLSGSSALLTNAERAAFRSMAIYIAEKYFVKDEIRAPLRIVSSGDGDGEEKDTRKKFRPRMEDPLKLDIRAEHLAVSRAAQVKTRQMMVVGMDALRKATSGTLPEDEIDSLLIFKKEAYGARGGEPYYARVTGDDLSEALSEPASLAEREDLFVMTRVPHIKATGFNWSIMESEGPDELGEEEGAEQLALSAVETKGMTDLAEWRHFVYQEGGMPELGGFGEFDTVLQLVADASPENVALVYKLAGGLSHQFKRALRETCGEFGVDEGALEREMRRCEMGLGAEFGYMVDFYRAQEKSLDREIDEASDNAELLAELKERKAAINNLLALTLSKTRVVEETDQNGAHITAALGWVKSPKTFNHGSYVTLKEALAA